MLTVRPNMTALLLALLSYAQAPSEDIDAFMKKVLERRQENWDQLHDYFCRERAILSLEGSLDGVPMQGFEREYLWFVKEGYFVRSPVSADGVPVSPEEREREETKWIERLKKREKERGPDRETFFGFKFEPGNYFYAGRQQLDGREVVVVEYYPDKGPWNEPVEDDEKESEEEKRVKAGLRKVLLVTMWIEPEAHQIVKMAMDNAGFDFLPGSWLLQVDTIEASLTMGQPLGDAWLIHDMNGYGKISTARGDIELRYSSTFYDYAKAKTGATYRFPPRGESEKRKQ
jgi:hypothetical protein